MPSKKFFKSLTLTGFVFGFAGWYYIAQNAVYHPWTLHMPLTHFVGFPHEDTFGAMCFVVSFICFFAYNMLREPSKR